MRQEDLVHAASLCELITAVQFSRNSTEDPKALETLGTAG